MNPFKLFTLIITPLLSFIVLISLKTYWYHSNVPGFSATKSITNVPYFLPAQATYQIANDLDKIIKKLPQGQIAYDIPNIFYVEERRFVKVNLTKDLSSDISRDLSNEASVERMQVNTFMTIDLIGDDFDIRPVTQTNQILGQSNILQWEWIVLPKNSGKKDLILKISARFKLSDGSQETYTLKTIRKSVEVKDNVPYFFGQNWKWFIEIAVALGLGGLIGSNFQRLKKFITRKGSSSTPP